MQTLNHGPGLSRLARDTRPSSLSPVHPQSSQNLEEIRSSSARPQALANCGQCAASPAVVHGAHVCIAFRTIRYESMCYRKALSPLTIYEGDLMYLEFFGKPTIVINSQEIAHELLEKRGAKYSDRPRMVTLAEMYVRPLIVTRRQWYSSQTMLISEVGWDWIRRCPCSRTCQA